MNQPFILVTNYRWLAAEGPHFKRLARQKLCPIGKLAGHLGEGCGLLLKYRSTTGIISVDPEAKLVKYKAEFYIRSKALAAYILDMRGQASHVLFYFDGDSTEARVIVHPAASDLFNALETEDPTLRLQAYDLPPGSTSIVSNNRVAEAIHERCVREDEDLHAVHANSFLEGPHILVPLYNHVLSLQADDNIRFPVVLKKLADSLRAYLKNDGKTISIHSTEKNHASFWRGVEGERFAFLDGGVARISSLASLEPMALRVGIYDVAPGVEDMDVRERWSLAPYVIGDIVARAPHGIRARTNRRRLREAARYVLEPLTGLAHLQKHRDTSALLLHGPLVTQFTMYDEGDPHNLPCMSPDFLGGLGISEADVTSAVCDIPEDRLTKRPLWNQFMAIYGFVSKRLIAHATPIAGVVERPRGRPMALAVLKALVADRVINQKASHTIASILEQYDVSDEFLFGCILKQGEYLSPLPLSKNVAHRARDRWRLVVAQYPEVRATLLKTEETRFPFRVEMNTVAAECRFTDTMAFLYHTARLLPRYAFPVGLDIVDKHAKIPDWIARGVSAELSGAILRRAIKMGDPRQVSQIRQFLSKSPRDFFFRPTVF